ncbi:hypothetical protein BD779DRAFT_1497292 [Infundibulicybe gibba]|nr:hypothetical protein BD779DRAFT_1497292 [Infundibulicybe gibba]
MLFILLNGACHERCSFLPGVRWGRKMEARRSQVMDYIPISPLRQASHDCTILINRTRARFSLDIWERIAFYLVASDGTFHGPPKEICRLSLVSRDVYNAINMQNNTRLYARIFRFKFDTAAIERRFSQRWLTPRCLASELVKRFVALKRIRGHREFQTDDLWTCYLMLSENDGRNESQLFNWAKLQRYLEQMLVHRLGSSPFSWYHDPISDALFSWILWMSNSREKLRDVNYSHVLGHIMHPFVAIGHHYPKTYAPDPKFHLPMHPEHDSEPLYQPRAVEIIHYSHNLTLAVPLVTSAAVLITTLCSEVYQDLNPIQESMHELPADRDTANALDIIGATVQDVVEFHSHTRIHDPGRCRPEISLHFDEDQGDESGGSRDEIPPGNSSGYDEDWVRLVSCYNPYGDNPSLRGRVFQIGSLAGSWEGRFLFPDFINHIGATMNPHLHPNSMRLQQRPLYWDLEEHHCLNPDQPIPGGIDEIGGDDVLNAWLPRGITIHHLEDAIEVFDPNTNHTVRYETFLPQGPVSYSKVGCEKLEQPWISGDCDGEVSQDDTNPDLGPQNLGASVTYIDNDEEYHDTVCHRSSGVSDIIITGKTSQRHGDAWGHFTLVGRVRSWDGLITLLRIPRDPEQRYNGQWIFKGYLHDRNLVGRWRETSTPADMIGFEGGFVVGKN